MPGVLRDLSAALFQDMVNRLRTTRLVQWAGKGFWAVMDQGLYGAANFILNALLARWLSEQAYGAFAVAFAAFVFFLAFYNALISEPMLVFGSGRYRERFPEYVSVLFDGHSGFAALSGLIFLIASLVFSLSGSTVLGYALLGLTMAVPFMLFGLMMRRACYVRHRPRLAAMGGGVYIAVVLIGAYILQRHGWLSAFSILCVMGGGGLAAGLLVAARLKLSWSPFRRSPFSAEVIRQHWDYGRWAVASRVPMRVPGSVVMIVLPIWTGLATTGAFQALLNLVMPIAQVNGALGVLLVPTLVQVRGRPRFFTFTRWMLLLFFLSAVAYWILLGSFNHSIVEGVYGGRYGGYAHLLWIVGLLPVFAGGIEVMSSALRASEQPDWIFWSHMVSAGVALPCTLGLIAVLGLEGAIAGIVLLNVITAAAMWFYFRRLRDVGSGAAGSSSGAPP